MLETTADQTAKVVGDTTRQAAQLAEAGIKKAWSILDAASEKKPPSEMLSQRAVRAVQGQAQG